MISPFETPPPDPLAGDPLTLGILGLGHLGLPLAVKAARAGYRVLGFDVDDDGHTALQGLPLRSVRLDEPILRVVDVVLLVTDHSTVDYQQVADHARLVVETRGVMRGFPGTARVVGLSGAEQAHGRAVEETEPRVLERAG
jgi:UDP-N-acetyl-D-mannosaminuronate dehydrogenase